MQIAQEASKAHRVALDRSPTPTLATLLQVRIDIPNAQVRKALLLTTRPSSVRNSSACVVRFDRVIDANPRNSRIPRVISSYQIAVKCLDGRHWGGCNGPMSMHQPQEHVHGSSVAAAPFENVTRIPSVRLRQLRSSQRRKSSHSHRCPVCEARVPDGTQPDQLSLSAIHQLLG